MQLAEDYADQAAGLRKMVSRRPTQVMAITSGKGGVGKTNVSVNLAIALSKMRKRVLLMDADLGLGNVDVVLGLRPEHNLSHALEGRCSLSDVIVTGPENIKILPAGSGVNGVIDLGATAQAGLIRAFSNPAFDCDVLLVDTAAGLTSSVLTFIKASQEIVVVLCDEPASITDAYALIKVLSQNHGRHRFRILANQVRNAREGRELFVKLLNVSARFLDVSLDYMGAVPFDECVHQAVKRQRAVLEAFPGSAVATAFKHLAKTTDAWLSQDEPSGHLEFFVERLVEASRVGA